MKSSNSALRAELGTTLRSLQASLRDLSNHLREEARDVWAWHAPNLPHAKAASKSPEDLPPDQALELVEIGSGVNQVANDSETLQQPVAAPIRASAGESFF